MIDSRPQTSNLIKALLVLLMLAGAAIRIGFALRPVQELSNFPLLDDSYYSLNIARNIAQGRGMTHDRVHKTNGFQPLFVFMAVPFYLLFPHDAVLPVRLMLFLGTFFSLFTGLFLFRIGRHIKGSRAGIFAALLWFLAPGMIEQDINGLETGIYVFFLISALWYYLSRIRSSKEPTSRQFATLGILAGLTALARIDGLLFIAAAGLDFLILSRKKPAALLLTQISWFAGAALVVVAPWFLNNLFNFGALMPGSGQAVRYLSLSPHASTYHAAGELFPLDPIPWGYYLHNLKFALVRLNRNPVIQTLLWFGLLAGYPLAGYLVLGLSVGWLIWLGNRNRLVLEDYFTFGRIRELYFTLVFSVGLVTAYITYIFCQWYYVRYFFPVQTLGLLYSGIIFDFTWEQLAQRNKQRATLILVSLSVIMIVSFGFRLYDKTQTTNQENDYYTAAIWLNENLPSDAVVGIFQSGAANYFGKQQIINLDGVVNNEALEAMQAKQMMAYIRKAGIQWIFDWPWMIEDYLIQASAPDSVTLKKSKTFGNRTLYQVVRQEE